MKRASQVGLHSCKLESSPLFRIVMAMNSYDALRCIHLMPNLIPGICRKFILSQFSKLDQKYYRVSQQVWKRLNAMFCGLKFIKYVKKQAVWRVFEIEAWARLGQVCKNGDHQNIRKLCISFFSRWILKKMVDRSTFMVDTKLGMGIQLSTLSCLMAIFEVVGGH